MSGPRRCSAALLAAALLPGVCRGSGYEFEGVGVRHVSRAGAAAADADDWTAAYWNPAGIVRGAQGRGGEAGGMAFGGWAFARDGNSLSSLPGLGAIFDRDRLTSPYVLGALGAILPVGRRWGLGFGVYTPLLQGADFQDTSPGGTFLDYQSRAGILITNLSVSRAITPALSAGAGINVLYGQLEVDILTVNTLGIGDQTTSRLKGDGAAVEGVLGLRWDFHPRWSAGLVVRSGADVPIRGKATAASTVAPAEATFFRYSLRQPPTADFGLAFRPSDAWTLTMDVHQTYWRRFTSEIRYDSPGTLLSSPGNTFNWRNTWKLRWGARWKATERTELLGGYSFDRPAVDPGSVDFASTVDVPMHRFSAGVAHTWGRFQASFGAIGGTGSRTENGILYRLSGLQLMGEGRVFF